MFRGPKSLRRRPVRCIVELDGGESGKKQEKGLSKKE